MLHAATDRTPGLVDIELAYNVTRTDRAQDFVEGSEEGSVDTEGENEYFRSRLNDSDIFDRSGRNENREDRMP